jgi:hypothetical protein
MLTRSNVIHRRVEDIGITVVALRLPRVGHERVRADKPPHLRQVVAGVHVDEAQVVRPRVVVPVSRKALAGDGGIRRRRGCEGAEGVVAGRRAGHKGAAGPAVGHDVAQVAGVGEVVGARACAHLRLDSYHLSGQPVGRAEGVGSCARRVGQFVVGERRVDDSAVGISAHHPLALGVVVICSGTDAHGR